MSLAYNFEDNKQEKLITDHIRDWSKLINTDLKVYPPHFVVKALFKTIVYRHNFYWVLGERFRSIRTAKTWIKRNSYRVYPSKIGEHCDSTTDFTFTLEFD